MSNTLLDAATRSLTAARPARDPQLKGVERRAAQWLRRFGTEVTVVKTDTSTWVTDSYRAHYVPTWVTSAFPMTSGRYSVTLKSAPRRLHGQAPDLAAVMRGVLESSEITLQGTAEVNGTPCLTFGYLGDTVTVNAQYVSHAAADGVVRLKAYGVRTPVYGLDEIGQVVAVIMPVYVR